MAKTLWKNLMQPPVTAQYFDSVEDARIPFTREAFSQAAEIYLEEGILFVTASRNKFLASFSRQTERLSTWNFFVPLKAMTGGKSKFWLQWFTNLCSEIPVVFGFGCSTTEYNAKHETIRNLPSGGRVIGWSGVAVREFSHYLPGFYWLNIFGSDLVQTFNLENLARLPNVKIMSLNSGQVAVQLNEPIVSINMDNRLLVERRLAQQIGEEYFFDREKSNSDYKQIPQIKKLFE
ncbi:MAG: hypothetical protein ABI954_14440 [Pyrinomonadaceae bacterium]